MNIDKALFRVVNGLAGRWPLLDEWWRFWANDYVVPSLLVGILAAGWFSREPRWRTGLLCAAIALGLANVLVALSNAIYFRPRPFTTHDDVTLLFYYPSDSTFPSNSAAVVWALSATIGFIAPRWRPAMLLALLMGFARVWVGVHYPFDILGGAAVGLLAAQAARTLRDRLGRAAGGLVWVARLLKLD